MVWICTLLEGKTKWNNQWIFFLFLSSVAVTDMIVHQSYLLYICLAKSWVVIAMSNNMLFARIFCCYCVLTWFSKSSWAKTKVLKQLISLNKITNVLRFTHNTKITFFIWRFLYDTARKIIFSQGFLY